MPAVLWKSEGRCPTCLLLRGLQDGDAWKVSRKTGNMSHHFQHVNMDVVCVTLEAYLMPWSEYGYCCVHLMTTTVQWGCKKGTFARLLCPMWSIASKLSP